MAKLAEHHIVILGENHWIRHDSELVASLVPALAEHRVVLAMEMLTAQDQKEIQQLVNAPTWDAAHAMKCMRHASWPYREYLEILHAAWEANRRTPGSMRILALSPHDWHGAVPTVKSLPYDQFMAESVTAEVKQGSRILVYCGQHHAFTRYHQPELTLAGKTRSYFDRMGNILWRRFGEEVFHITLQAPMQCGREPWTWCLPLGGDIDCAGAKLGRPVGFDVATSPFGYRFLDPDTYYAKGHPALSLAEYSDGWIWTKPIEQYQNVRIIPLAEFAPDEMSLKEVAADNPFTDDHSLTKEKIEALWKEQETAVANPLNNWKWQHLRAWRSQCH